jgi:hypothetical protein
MLSGSSPIFALSNHITCSQSQTGVTVPLKVHMHEIFLLSFYSIFLHHAILKDPLLKIYKIYEILFQINTDIQRFSSLSVFARSTHLNFALSPKIYSLTWCRLLNCAFLHCLVCLQENTEDNEHF